jgi:hypothetical protein
MRQFSNQLLIVYSITSTPSASHVNAGKFRFSKPISTTKPNELTSAEILREDVIHAQSVRDVI